MKTMIAALAAAIAITLPVAASAEFKLDSRYTDADGDLIADTPTDISKQTDPSTLIFAYNPGYDSAVYREAWTDFLAYLSETTGKKVQLFPAQSTASQIEAMRDGRLHAAGFNTGSIPLAVACAGFHPFAMMARADGSFGYEMEIITYPDSGIATVNDIRGKQLAFTSRTSNSGFKAPSAILKADYSMTPGIDYEPVFSGTHDKSILGVANKEYPAAAIANTVLARMIKRDLVKADQIRSIYKSQSFPTTGYGMAHDLKPELQRKIVNSFKTFKWKGSSLEKEFSKSGGAQFIPTTFKANWAVIRKIDAANDVEYRCN